MPIPSPTMRMAAAANSRGGVAICVLPRRRTDPRPLILHTACLSFWSSQQPLLYCKSGGVEHCSHCVHTNETGAGLEPEVSFCCVRVGGFFVRVPGPAVYRSCSAKEVQPGEDEETVWIERRRRRGVSQRVEGGRLPPDHTVRAPG